MDEGSRALQADFFADGIGLGSTQRAIARPAAPRDLSRDRRAAVQESEITLDARLFLRAALGCIAVLVGIGLLVAYLGYAREESIPRVILRAFLLEEEQNLPTFFAFSLLAFCAVLLALIGARAFLLRQQYGFHWMLLGAIFFLIAFDEAAKLHEKLNGPVGAVFGRSGPIYYPWVIPAAGLVVVLALFYLPFLRGLPAPFGRLFLLSGSLYVGGALGVEMLGASYADVHSTETFTYHLFATIEETLEMLGLAVFAYALMRFLAAQHGRVCLGFRAG